MADQTYEEIAATLDRLEGEVSRLRVAQAEYFQAHKDDPGEWDDSPLKVRRGRFGAVVSVRLSPEEADALRDWARATKRSYSDIVREAVRKELAHPHLLTIRTGG